MLLLALLLPTFLHTHEPFVLSLVVPFLLFRLFGVVLVDLVQLVHDNFSPFIFRVLGQRPKDDRRSVAG